MVYIGVVDEKIINTITNHHQRIAVTVYFRVGVRCRNDVTIKIGKSKGTAMSAIWWAAMGTVSGLDKSVVTPLPSLENGMGFCFIQNNRPGLKSK